MTLAGISALAGCASPSDQRFATASVLQISARNCRHCAAPDFSITAWRDGRFRYEYRPGKIVYAGTSDEVRRSFRALATSQWAPALRFAYPEFPDGMLVLSGTGAQTSQAILVRGRQYPRPLVEAVVGIWAAVDRDVQRRRTREAQTLLSSKLRAVRASLAPFGRCSRLDALISSAGSARVTMSKGSGSRASTVTVTAPIKFGVIADLVKWNGLPYLWDEYPYRWHDVGFADVTLVYERTDKRIAAPDISSAPRHLETFVGALGGAVLESLPPSSASYCS